MLDRVTPFNIELMMPLGNDQTRSLRPIKVTDIMSGMTKNFHPDGLFSTEIFGKVGDVRRNQNFGVIDLGIGIFHPVYYKALTDMKELYGGIISGKEYAVFDPQLKDFVKSDPVHGETGFKFFIDYMDKLQFAERDSAKRSFNIKLVEKHRKQPLFDKLVVLPAGLRDYVVDENGKPSEDEINGFYRRVIGISNIIQNVAAGSNEEYLNQMRFNLQSTVNTIYDYIKAILEGKSKFVQQKWIGRNIDNSTRNVITPYIQRVKSRTDPQFVSTTQTVVGTYQFLRAILPKAVQLVRDGFLSRVFIGASAPANLTDPKTLQTVSVLVKPSYYDDWMTPDGLESAFHRFKVKDLRHEPIMIGPYYLGLTYRGPDKTYRFLTGIDELPEGRNKDDVQPITYAELFYAHVFQEAAVTPCTVTRYPITGLGSIYPGYSYLKSTIKGEVRAELGDDWLPTGKTAPEFPMRGDLFFDALSPSSQHLGRLGGDYDGDTVSFICYLTDEAREENRKYLNSKTCYLAPDGSMAYSAANDVINLVLGNLV